jgi:hypothetical protein
MTTTEQKPELVCSWCLVYEREERFDGHSHYTVCVPCGRSEFRVRDTYYSERSEQCAKQTRERAKRVKMERELARLRRLGADEEWLTERLGTE